MNVVFLKFKDNIFYLINVSKTLLLVPTHLYENLAQDSI